MEERKVDLYDKIEPEKILYNEPDQYMKSINMKLSINTESLNISWFSKLPTTYISSHFNLELLHDKLKAIML